VGDMPNRSVQGRGLGEGGAASIDSLFEEQGKFSVWGAGIYPNENNY
jgi:hypothetical protein